MSCISFLLQVSPVWAPCKKIKNAKTRMGNYSLEGRSGGSQRKPLLAAILYGLHHSFLFSCTSSEKTIIHCTKLLWARARQTRTAEVALSFIFLCVKFFY